MSTSWIRVCSLADITPNTGLCALVQGAQVALFRPLGFEQVFALGNYDPVGQANVLSRGLIAEMGDELTVASPLYKHHYRLRDGACIEQADLSVPVYSVRISEGYVEVQAG